MKPDSLADRYKIERTKELIEQIMVSGVYSGGEVTADFEGAISERYQNKPVLSFSNCGTALFALYRYLKYKGAESVIVQNNTFYATAAMAAEAGLSPILCDSKKDDPSMSVDSMIEAHKLTKAKAVCLTHVGGWIASDYVKIAEYCHANKIVLIEDAAHVFGVFNRYGHSAGSLGSAAAFSFFPTKAVPGGEGGAVVINEKRGSNMLDWLSHFRDYGKHYKDGAVERYGRGFNLRMSEFDAAPLLVQMWSTDEIMGNRLVNAMALQDNGFVCAMGEVNNLSNFYKYPIRVKEYEKGNYRTMGGVYSLNDQIYESCKVYKMDTPVALHNSREWAATHVCLPINEKLYHQMTDEEIRDYILRP